MENSWSKNYKKKENEYQEWNNETSINPIYEYNWSLEEENT